MTDLLTKDLFDAIVESAYNRDIDVQSLDELVDDDTEHQIPWRLSYSGRYMYGSDCVGVICSGAGAFARFILAVNDADEELAQAMTERLSTDNMGFDTIYYFPGVQAEEEFARWVRNGGELGDDEDED
jgi:hypothetical protein